MALYFYRNLLTNALVYSDQPSPPEGDGNLELIGEQTNMAPTSESNWVFDDMRSTFTSVEKDDRLIGKIAGLTSMNSMFYGCSSLTSCDLSGFDTSQVMHMTSMFNDCSSLVSLDLSGFDTSKATSISYMFYGCSSLVSLDLSGFDTSKAIHMNYMFRDCSSLKSLDLSGFDTSKVMNMSNMLYGCSSLMSLDLSGFNTSQVTSMNSMFCNCSTLTSLDLSGFDTSQVTSVYRMFYGCSSLHLVSIGDSISNGLSQLPASQYYPASGGDPVAKTDLTAGTWVRDEADLSKVATLVEQAQAFAALRRDAGRLEKRIAALEKAAG